jgi:flavin-dependent dehydrogenase
MAAGAGFCMPSSPDRAPTCDVAVIGAGLAGLTVARLLSERGLSVLLADRKTDLTQGVHTTGIFVRRTLEDFEFPPECLGPSVRHVTLYSPSLRPLSLESLRDEFRVGRMPLLYERLLQRCRDSGVDVRLGTRLVEISADGRGNRLRLAASGEEFDLDARFVIGVSENVEWIVGVEEVLKGIPLDGPPRFHCVLDPELSPGYLAWIVHDGEEVHLGVGGYAKHFEPWEALARFREIAAGLVDLSAGRLVEKRGGRIPVGGVLPRIVSPRGLLVGDAAGAVSPLTAGGLDPCLRMSRLAADVTELYLATGDVAALEYYNGRWFRGKFRRRLMMRWAIRHVRSRAALEAACFLFRLPMFGHLAERVFFGHGSFPDPPRIPESAAKR